MSAIGNLAKEYSDYDEQVIVRIECSVRDLREAEQAEARALAAEKDAVRYRWLADKVIISLYDYSFIIEHNKGPSKIYGTSIDAAIDAAQEATDGEVKPTQGDPNEKAI